MEDSRPTVITDVAIIVVTDCSGVLEGLKPDRARTVNEGVDAVAPPRDIIKTYPSPGIVSSATPQLNLPPVAAAVRRWSDIFWLGLQRAYW